MERNYAGGYSGGGQPSNLVSSGRRAGTVRTGTPDAAPAAGGYADDAASHQARFGRRASPGAYPSGGGMDMDPPRGGASGYTPSAAAGAPRAAGIPRSGAAAGAYSASPAASSAAAAAAAPPPGAAAAGPSSKLSGLQRLKEAAASRLVSRIPSGGRHAPESAGYVPSAMTHQAPARPAPLRAGSGGGGGASSGTSAAGRPPSTGSSGYGYSSSAAAGAAAGRPGSGRSASTGAALGAGSRAPGASSGYGYGSSAAGTSSTSASGRPPSGSGAASAAAGSAARPSALASLAARRQQTAEPAAAAPPRAPPAAAPPPRAPPAAAPPPRGLSGPIRAPPPPAPAPSYGGGGGGYGGGGGFSGGGGGGFDAGTIPPGADDPGPTGPMVECPSCGRRFNEQAYSKHAKICEKVFAQKRKPVNMAAKRLEGSEAAKFFDMRKGVPKSEAKGASGPPGRAAPGRGAGAAGGTRLDDRPLPGSKMPKWKAQSEQLRQAMAANKRIADAAARGVDIKDVKFTPTPAEQDDRVPCPHCGRKFAELTAERHIPKCRDILAKPKFLGAKSGRGAHVRR